MSPDKAMRKIAHEALAMNNQLAPRLVTALAAIRGYPTSTPNPPRGKRLNRGPIMHYRDKRLMVNAGVDMPACFASAPILDMDKCKLLSTRKLESVSCKRCLNMVKVSA
jgi:hypothetical protein